MWQGRRPRRRAAGGRPGKLRAGVRASLALGSLRKADRLDLEAGIEAGEIPEEELPAVPFYGADLALVWQAFWTIRNGYDGSQPIPMHGIRDGLQVLGLFEDADWIAPLLLGMDQEFCGAVRESKSAK